MCKGVRPLRPRKGEGRTGGERSGLQSLGPRHPTWARPGWVYRALQDDRARRYPPVVIFTRSMRGCPGTSTSCSAKPSA
jgi:hypothetical protein